MVSADSPAQESRSSLSCRGQSILQVYFSAKDLKMMLPIARSVPIHQKQTTVNFNKRLREKKKAYFL